MSDRCQVLKSLIKSLPFLHLVRYCMKLLIWRFASFSSFGRIFLSPLLPVICVFVFQNSDELNFETSESSCLSLTFLFIHVDFWLSYAETERIPQLNIPDPYSLVGCMFSDICPINRDLLELSSFYFWDLNWFFFIIASSYSNSLGLPWWIWQ